MGSKQKAYSTLKREKITRIVNEIDEFVKERKRTAIVLTEEEYTDIIQEIFGIETVLSYEYDGICIDYLDADGICEGPDETEICEELAKYFGFKQVSSIHLDDCDKRGVWICYV